MMNENVAPANAAPRRQSIGGGFLPIKALTNINTKWKIQARVVEKGQLTAFHRKQGGAEGHVFSCVVMDKEGSQINMKFWNSCAQEWHAKLEKGTAYTFSKGRIQLANKRYSGTVNHDYEITYDREAEIVPIEELGDEQSIPVTRTMQYQSLRAINMSTKKMPFVTNVLGVVHSFQLARDVGASGRKRRAVTVVDATGFSLDVTLWGSEAEVDESVLEPHPVVALHNLQIREWRGRAGSTLNSSEVIWNFQETDEARSLKQWYDVNGQTAEVEPMTNIAGEQQLQQQTVKEAQIAELTPLLEDNASDANLIVRCTAYITSMMYRNPRQDNMVNVVYEACPKCQRKLPNEGGGHCNTCHETVTPAPRMAFSATIADVSGGGFLVRIFNDVAQRLTGMSAAKCLELQNATNQAPNDPVPSDLLTAFEQKNIFQRYQFTLRGRRDTYQNELRNSFAVLNIAPATKGTITAQAMKRCLSLCPSVFDVVASKRVCEDDGDLSASKRVRLED